MVSTTQLVVGGLFLASAWYVTQHPEIISNTVSQIQGALSNLGPKSSVSGTAPVSGISATNVNPTGAPTQALVTPPLSSIEGGIILPIQQSQFCDISFGLTYDPLQGKCVQAQRGFNGRCAPGSVFNHCQCQCVPVGIPQPQCWRDCTQTCPDKQNTVWNWCALGCIGRSASFNLPNCPPL